MTQNNTNSTFGDAIKEVLGNRPRPVILVTDWWTDVDDVVAARIMVWAELKGMIDLIGIVSNCSNGKIIPSIDAFFTGEGRPNIPMGVDKTPLTITGTPPYQENMMLNRHYYASEATAESDVSFLRRALLSSEVPVDIISIGYLNNLSNLLNSKGDSISPSSGIDLIRQKVNHLWVMGGQYPSGTENNFARDGNAAVISSAYNTVANWPTKITFLGYEAGLTVVTGDTVQTTWPAADDMLSKAMVDFNTAGAFTPGSGRSSWDPMLVLLACYGHPVTAGYTTVEGTNAVDPITGANTFTANKNGNHRYVIKRRTDNWFKLTINTILDKKDWNFRNDIGIKQIQKPTINGGAVDFGNLAGWWNVDDLSTNTSGNGIYHLEDRSGSNHLRCGVSAEKPTYFSNIGGKRVITFAGAQRLNSDFVSSYENMTIYTSVYVTALPGATNTFISQDGEVANGIRIYHASVNSGGVSGAATFNGTSGTGTTAGTLSINTWHVVALVISKGNIQVFLNGVGGTKTYVNTNVGSVPITMGARNYTGTINEGFTGSIHEARIYKTAHDATTMASVVAQMA